MNGTVIYYTSPGYQIPDYLIPFPLFLFDIPIYFSAHILRVTIFRFTHHVLRFTAFLKTPSQPGIQHIQFIPLSFHKFDGKKLVDYRQVQVVF